MRSKAFIGFVLLGLCLFPLSAGLSPHPHVKIEQPSNKGSIKILLYNQIEGANLEVRGGYKLYDPKTGAKIAKGVLNKQFLLRPTLDGLAWGEQFPGIFQIALVPNSSDTYILVNGIQYSGDLYVYQIGNTISIVNVLPIEEFVKAMLNPKVNAQLHPEVLASLAIVARTQAYFYSTRNESSLWQLDARKIGYQGACVCSRGNGVDQAVATTHHLVMKSDRHGTPDGFFDATYTVNCAGKTAPYHVIHKKEGFAPHKGVEAPLAKASRMEAKWSFAISKDELAEKLGLGEIKKYDLHKEPVSGKVYGLRLEAEEGVKDLSFFELQAMLGEKQLKSSDFALHQEGGHFSFEGYGEGPGTGLCLFSAQEMAKRGKNAAEILEAFFPQMHISYMDVKK